MIAWKTMVGFGMIKHGVFGFSGVNLTELNRKKFHLFVR